MKYSFVVLVVTALIFLKLQLDLVSLLRSRFPTKWSAWGEPHPYSLTSRASGIRFLRLVFGSELVRLGDPKLTKQVKRLRFAFMAFVFVFIVTGVVFFTARG